MHSQNRPVAGIVAESDVRFIKVHGEGNCWQTIYLTQPPKELREWSFYSLNQFSKSENDSDDLSSAFGASLLLLNA